MIFHNVRFKEKLLAPPSKSQAIRILLCSALSKKPCRVLLSDSCSDIETALSALPVFGAKIERDSESVTVIPASDFPQAPCIIPDFRDCGTVMRLFLPVMQSLWTDVAYKADERLRERVRGTLLTRDEILSDITEVDASLSSQTLSGLLFAKALAGGSVRVKGQTVSRPYVDMTLDVISRFSLKRYDRTEDFFGRGCGRFPGCDTQQIEADWSGAAYLLVAGAIGKNPVTVSGLNTKSVQGDKIIISILSSMGACITEDKGLITSSPASLRALCLDAKDCPDLIPPLSAAATAAVGISVFSSVDRLRTKESDRVSSICRMINEAGGFARYDNGNLYIKGPVTGGHLSSSEDHRITMAQILLSLISEKPVETDDCSSISKSFGNFLNCIADCN